MIGLMDVNSKPEGFTVHLNSDTKINFCVKMCLAEQFKWNCSCLIISPSELIFGEMNCGIA